MHEDSPHLLGLTVVSLVPGISQCSLNVVDRMPHAASPGKSDWNVNWFLFSRNSGEEEDPYRIFST